jgi:hypothetical protein
MTKKKSKPAPRPRVRVTFAMVVGWLTSVSMVLAAVLPVLPEATPSWLREVLAVLAVAIAATLQSWRAPSTSSASDASGGET